MSNPPQNLLTTNLTATNKLGGPFNGYSATQTKSGVKSNEDATIRKIVVRSWNTPYAKKTYNSNHVAVGPYRAVNNLGDYLSRQNYSCGGSNQISSSKPGLKRVIGAVPQHCDLTGVPASSTNVRFVSDSSDYMRFKKQTAINNNYNDLSNGGDESNGSYVPLMRVRR